VLCAPYTIFWRLSLPVSLPPAISRIQLRTLLVHTDVLLVYATSTVLDILVPGTKIASILATSTTEAGSISAASCATVQVCCGMFLGLRVKSPALGGQKPVHGVSAKPGRHNIAIIPHALTFDVMGWTILLGPHAAVMKQLIEARCNLELDHKN